MATVHAVSRRSITRLLTAGVKKSRLLYMPDAIQKAVDHFGGVRPMAEKTGFSRAAIYFWLSGSQRISAEYACRLESASGGAVTREELRPDVFVRAGQ